MAEAQRIGVFGGTFDPIHAGHLAIARAALKQARLDRVLFVIAANPPHKTDESVTPAPVRAAMTAAAIEDEPAFAVSYIELEREGPSYTADTLCRLQRDLPGASLFFVLGYDSALDLPRWREPDRILAQATLLVAPRPENSRPLPPMVEKNSWMLDMPEYAVSSSDIRARARNGEDMTPFLPASVVGFIQEKGLYHARVPAR